MSVNIKTDNGWYHINDLKPNLDKGCGFIKEQNIGMLVFPVIIKEDLSSCDCINKGIFFENINEGFEYQEKMDEENDGSKFNYYTNVLLKYKKGEE